MKVFIIRHGHSSWNNIKRITGQLDPPLSEKGVEQAMCLATVLRQERLGAIFTNTLCRAVETARPTADLHGLEIQRLDELRELHMGN